MRISVAMATYNGGRYLREQLDSIARQSLLPAELVICDDGSSDDTVEVARRFAGTAPFPVIIDDHGQRLGHTRNFFRAVEQCRGEIVALCDQDDAWDEEKLATCLPPFADERVTSVTHRVRLVDEGLNPTGMVLPTAPAAGEYTVFNVDPWFSPNGMQLLFRRERIGPWLQEPRPLSTYGFGAAPFDEWIFHLSVELGVGVVLDDILGVWRRHARAATDSLQAIKEDHTTSRQLHLALHSGGETYEFRAGITDSRAESAARSVVSPTGEKLTTLPGTAEFFRGMSRRLRRRVRLHNPKTGRLARLSLFLGMAARRDYRSRSRGGLGAKAVLKDGFTVLFGPRPPSEEAGTITPSSGL